MEMWLKARLGVWSCCTETGHSSLCANVWLELQVGMSQAWVLVIILRYIYHALIDAVNVHMIHISVKTTVYAHLEQSKQVNCVLRPVNQYGYIKVSVEQSPSNTIYI